MLTIKEVSAYYPYGVQCVLMGHLDEEDNPIIEKILGICSSDTIRVSLGDDYDEYYISDCFPALRPLSDLTKEIEHNGERFVPILKMFGGDKNNCTFKIIEKMFGIKKISISVNGVSDDCISFSLSNVLSNMLNYEAWQFLLGLHFDIFNLIPQNLAIDLNTIK